MNAGLFVINVFTHSNGGNWWFYWPLGAWGIALVVHATTLLRLFSPEWSERKAREYVERAKRS